MIHLKIELADGTEIDTDEFAEHIRSTDTLTTILNQEVVVHPDTLQWIDGIQSFEEAEANNPEDDDGAGGYIPYDSHGVPIRTLHPEEKELIDEDEYYYQISEIKWVGKTHYEQFVAQWMNENRDSYKGLIYNGCISGMVGELIYHNQVLDCIKEHKSELEAIIQETANSLGDMGFLFGESEHSSDFSFDKLVWMCFEQTVRNTLNHLMLTDI